MLAGALICMSAMLLLGFTRPFASIFTSSGSTAVCKLLIHTIIQQYLSLLRL